MILDTDFYLSVPWTTRREEFDDDGPYVALTIDELPGFVAASRDEDELAQLYWDALEAFIESYVADGDQPPMPAGYQRALAQLDTLLRDAKAASVPQSSPSGSTGVDLPTFMQQTAREGEFIAV